MAKEQPKETSERPGAQAGRGSEGGASVATSSGRRGVARHEPARPATSDTSPFSLMQRLFEDLDRVFGLVDPNDVPTDGALAALSGAYLTDAAAAGAPTSGN